ncbi:aspartyl protease family protein [Paenibacillus sp. GD4]|jgi:hypothetical protein|uniref:aspartyl protease family protein n=1 Tax=Paenibacillus sp. GD4 TaxID=3068890 RepID=UPI00279676D7|nr:aspartyl protease family protein [Paenibacillus sp. GD4]MDQ1912324.1 aspartyl protease family protein [Paenibacillus sp. GD4]
MQIRMIRGLPIVSLSMEYNNRTIELTDVLFDTGCAATVFDTDVLAALGLYPDFINGTVKRMYGIGGTSEACYEQWVRDIRIDFVSLPSFRLQLGSIHEPYGFAGIIGIDYMLQTGLKVDFEKMQISYSIT